MRKIIIGVILIIVVLAGAIFVLSEPEYFEPEPEQPDEPNQNVLTINHASPWQLQSDSIEANYDSLRGVIYMPITYVGETGGYYGYRIYANNKEITIHGNAHPMYIAVEGLNPNLKVPVDSLSPGTYALTVKAVDDSNNCLAQDSIALVIPNQWVYYFNTVGRSSGDQIIRGDPYEQELRMNQIIPGRITRIEGEVEMDFLGNGPCEVWFNFCDKCTYTWNNGAYKLMNPVEGWNNIDFTVSNNVKSYVWAIVGCHYYDDVSRAYNKVVDFRGNIYVEAGTYFCDGDILQLLQSINPFRVTESIGPSCNC